jgi:Tol biopolymer transport system component
MNRQILILAIILTLTACATKITKQTSLNYSDREISTPELFAEGIISTKDKSVFNLTFTNNGKTIYFTRRQGNEKQKIYFTKFVNNEWTEPQVASFSTDRDENPFISTDGKTIYFGSARPIQDRPNKGNFDMNIWKTECIDNKWSDPIPLSDIINQVQIENEEWPSSNENSIYSPNGVDYFYATMLRGTKTIEMYETKLINGEFSKPLKLNGLFDDGKYWKSTPTMSPDGDYLVFNAYGVPDGKGGEDIYVCKKIADGWSKAKNIGALINTSSEEGGANFSKDGKYFFFARELKETPDKDGIWSIYYVESKFLKLEELFNN